MIMDLHLNITQDLGHGIMVIFLCCGSVKIDVIIKGLIKVPFFHLPKIMSRSSL